MESTPRNSGEPVVWSLFISLSNKRTSKSLSVADVKAVQVRVIYAFLDESKLYIELQKAPMKF